jgi:hypothetical protein
MEIVNTTEEFVSMKSRDPVTLRCLQCKSTFVLLKHRVMDYQKHGGLHGSFCSWRCRGNHKNKQQLVLCDMCHTSVVRPQKELKKSQKHFCSSSCSAKYWNSIKYPVELRSVIKRRQYDPLTHKHISNKVETTCSTCSKKFYRYPSSLPPTTNNCRFCSRSCQAIYANKTWNKSPRFGINKSRCETILKDIILAEFPTINILENDRSTLPGSLEFDIYIPSKKIGIELNGPCHFIPIFGADALKTTRNHDQIKLKFCQDNSIKFFVINIMGIRNQKQMLQEVFNKQIKQHLI